MPDDRTLRAIPRVAEFIAKADALLITAGAGMGVDSGLPDFRGPEGFWRAYPALGQRGISFEQMAQPSWFIEEPETAWAFYGHRQQLYRETVPHDGFRRLLEWGRAMPAGYFVVTSNVDGQFQFADFDRTRLLEKHGNIHRHQCTTPCGHPVWYYEDDEWPRARRPDLEVDLATMRAQGRLPRCPECGALARPNVLMFDDSEWVSSVTREQERRYRSWLASIRGRRLVALELGAGTAIAAIRWHSEKLAGERSRTTLVRVNPDATDAEEPVFSVRLGAREALQRIEARLPEGFRERCRSTVPAAQTVCLFDEVSVRPTDGARRVASEDLTSLKCRRMTSKAWTCRLASGIEVWVERIEVERNYQGFELGVAVPPAGQASRVIEEARAFVRAQFDGPEPVAILPTLYDATSDAPILPPLRFAARIVSEEPVGDACGSWMNLIWFAGIDDEKSIKRFVEEALAQVDWKRQATGYDV